MASEFASLREKSGLSVAEIAERCAVSLRTVYRWENGECRPQALALKQLQTIAEFANRMTNKSTPEFRYIDLFAGIGGFRKAFDAIGGKCVFTSEWDKACRTTYQANYTCDHPVEGDIRDFTQDKESLAKIPEHDVLVAGFPCQPFSIAGVSKKNALGRPHGFKCDTQGTLFFDVAQIIEYHNPVAFLLENVKNLMNHDKGNTFRVIKRTLEEELGYTLDYKIINGKSWVPQQRQRIFIVGFKSDISFSFDNMKIPDPVKGPKLGSILHDKNDPDDPPYVENGKISPKYTLTPRMWEYLKNYKKKHQAKGNGFGFGLCDVDDVARTLSARYYKDGSEILIKQHRRRPRRLTPRECARLMGFDRPSENSFVIPVSDTQAYKQFGNSVIVPVAQTVARHMKPFILQSTRGLYSLTPQLPFDVEKGSLAVA